MEFTPIRTRTLMPPKDDLLEVLDMSLPPLQERDVLAIASKAVAIHEGRCVAETDPETKKRLVEEESDHIIPTSTPNGWDLTVQHHMAGFAGGIDESNAGEHLILLPKEPNKSAAGIRQYLCQKYGLKELGIVITDSTGLPYRQGVIGISIGHAGFAPVKSEIGVPDLFGRSFNYTYLNVVDAIAVGAAFSMGETNESTPLCIVRDIPHIEFTDKDRSTELLIRPEDDLFYPLLKGTYEKS